MPTSKTLPVDVAVIEESTLPSVPQQRLAALSIPIRKYRDVFRLVGRTPLSARNAFVPPKSARGPTAVQGDRPSSAVQALNSSSYLRTGIPGILSGNHGSSGVELRGVTDTAPQS